MTAIFSGPTNARIMLVGEAPGAEEERTRQPFVGPSGYELTKILMDAGLNRHECFITNVTSSRPPDNDIDTFFLGKRDAKALGATEWHGKYPTTEIWEGLRELHQQIDRIRPQIIVGFGNTPLWALTGHTGIMAWRGSALQTTVGNHTCDFLPTIHPANILRDYTSRFYVVRDLQRVATALREGGLPKRPDWNFIVKPTFDRVMDQLAFLINWAEAQHSPQSPFILATDIETRNRQIACVGTAWSKMHALCIPFMSAKIPEGYWPPQEELAIILKLRELLTHPNVSNIFHNGAYDCQYFAYQWGYVPNVGDDTMIAQHVAFVNLRKSLSMCSSLYCNYHRYWKDDGKTWDGDSEEQLWVYNCEDCVRTYEVWENLMSILERLNQLDNYQFQVRELFPLVLQSMLRGVPIDFAKRMEFDNALSGSMVEAEEWLATAVGHPLKPKSSQQMAKLLYTDFGIKPIFNRKTKSVTTDDDALNTLRGRHPVLKPLLDKVSQYRSEGVFLSTFVRASIPPDGRIRCTYNMAGTKTFRLSSSEDSFGFGTNLQNVSTGEE